MADVFISYSRTDKEFVSKLHAKLVKEERKPWVDWQDISPAADFLAETAAKIETADNFVFVLSPDSIKSPWCKRELDHAVKYNKRLVPIQCRKIEDDNLAQVPSILAKLNWISFLTPDEFDAKSQALLKALDIDLDWVRTHTRLLTRAIEWNRKKRNDALVLRNVSIGLRQLVTEFTEAATRCRSLVWAD